jgi:arylsulfatase A-like enzyme
MLIQAMIHFSPLAEMNEMKKNNGIKPALQRFTLMVPLVVGWVHHAQASNRDGEQSDLPNIVFIMADDLGYSDVGYMKHKKGIQTPNIDALALSGMVFTDAYAACPVCSPTRASVLTGKYPGTLKITNHVVGKASAWTGDKEGDQEKELKKERRSSSSRSSRDTKENGENKLQDAFYFDHLPDDEITIAEVLKEKGYSTGYLGKWHLGGAGSLKTSDGIVNEDYQPEKQGFDVNIGGCAYGQPRSYFSPYRNGTIEDGPEGEYLTDRLGDEAVKFISDNKGRPFFLDLSTYTVHRPLKAPEETVDKYDGNTYFAMIEKLDENVGKVMDALKEMDLLEKTVVIFYSDNGGVEGNPPLQGKKCSLHEGGIRVPLVVSWPGKIKAGSTCMEPVTSVDFFPTFLELASGSPESYPELEGLSLFPLLFEKGDFPERAIYWHFPHNRGYLSMGGAIREGDWKLMKRFDTKEVYLYNLKDDLSEENNLAKKYPERVKDLIGKLEKWQKDADVVMPSK